MATAAPPLKCEACNKENKAVLQCHTCNDLICADCLWMHEHWDILKTHCIQDLPQAPSQWTDEERRPTVSVRTCSVHPEKLMTRYCERCEQLLCHTCCFFYHNSSSHSIIGLLEAEVTLKECIIGLASKVTGMALDLGKNLATVDQCFKRLQARCEDIELKITEKASKEAMRAPQEIRRIREEEARLIQELEQIYRERVNAQRMAKTEIQEETDQALNLSEEVNNLDSKQDCQTVLSLKCKLSKQLTKLAARQRKGVPDGESFVTFVEGESAASLGRLVSESSAPEESFRRIKSPKTTEFRHSIREIVRLGRQKQPTGCEEIWAVPSQLNILNNERQSPNGKPEREDKLSLQSKAVKPKRNPFSHRSLPAHPETPQATLVPSEQSEHSGSFDGLVLQAPPKHKPKEHRKHKKTMEQRDIYCKADKKGKTAIPGPQSKLDDDKLRSESNPCPQEKWIRKTELRSFGPGETNFASATYVAVFPDSKTVVVDHLQTELISFFTNCKPGSRAGPQQLHLPGLTKASNAAVNNNKVLVILDNPLVKVFDQRRHLLHEFIPMTGRDSTRSCLAIDDDDIIAVGYSHRKEVSLHKLNGTNIKKLKAPMIQDYLSTNSKRIIYTNYKRKKLLGISYDGASLFSVNIPGRWQTDWGPTGVCCNSEGSIYVAVDTGEKSGEIHHFSLEAVHLGCILKDCGPPRGIAYTQQGELVVTTKYAVQIYCHIQEGNPKSEVE